MIVLGRPCPVMRTSKFVRAENDHVINTFAKNFRILNFFEDEINLEEIKYEKIIRGMNSEDQKF